MRLTTILLITGFLQVSASTFAQKISLSEKDVSLTTVLNRIKAQTGYDFFYESVKIRDLKNISIQVKNEGLKDVLARILNPQNLDFEIYDNSIVIKSKQQNLVTRLQNIDVRGRIMTENGIPLAGATISIKGSDNRFTKSDGKGEFSFANVREDAVLIITYIGYSYLEVPLKGKSMPLEIKLNETTGELEEVSVTINTGYLKILPQQSTGAVSQLTTKQYESQINANFLDGLQNNLPGLLINNNIKLNGNNLFQIRGLSTFSANSQPLIVLDGYVTSLNINGINPNEIKSVTLLKDAAATAIYGVKASNGVILIERKDAQEGKPQVSFRPTFTFTPEENYSSYRWAPADTYIKYLRYIDQNGATQPLRAGYDSPIIPGQELLFNKAAGYISQSQMEEGFGDLLSYNNTKDYQRLFLRTAFTQSYTMDVSGGNSSATYYVTGSYTGNKLNQINNDNHQLLLSSRLNLNFSKRLSLMLNADYNERQNNAVPVPHINAVYPFEHFQNTDGSPASIYNGSATNKLYNQHLLDQGLLDAMAYPLNDINEISDKTHTVDNRITANFNYDIGSGFKLIFGGKYERSHSKQSNYASGNSSLARQVVDYFAVADASENGYNFQVPLGGYLKQTGTEQYNYMGRAQLNYNETFGKDHMLSAVVGGEIGKTVNQTDLESFFGYNEQTLLQRPVDYKSLSQNYFDILPTTPIHFSNYNTLFNQSYTDDRIVSAYGNVYYTFRSTYSLTGSIRIDQSNLFGTDPKYRYKPLWSVGAAWNIQNEQFMKNIDWVHNLRLRLSQGYSGNVAKNSIPQIIAQAEYNNFTALNSLTLFSPANGGLRWEKTANYNAGLDYAIFKGISGSIEYYIKKSTDLLSQVTPATLDATKGSLGTAFVNIGSMRNQGLELNLNADWIRTRWLNWYTGFVLSRNTNMVTKGFLPFIGDNDYSVNWVTAAANGNTFIPGYSSGAIFSYRSAGLDADGVPKIYDQNGKVIEKPGSFTARDQGKDWVEYSGTSIPVYAAGMSNRVDIGNFYVNFKVDYFGGNKVRLPAPTPDAAHPLQGAQDFWQKPGDEAHTNIMNPLAQNTTSQEQLAYSSGNVLVVNGAYLTLSAITLSYNFSRAPVFKKLGFKRFELLLQANSLYTKGFNKYNYSLATGDFAKRYPTPTYTIGLYTDF